MKKEVLMILSMLTMSSILFSCGGGKDSSSSSSKIESTVTSSVESSVAVTYENLELSSVHEAREANNQQSYVGKHVKVKGKISYVEGDYFYLQKGSDAIVVRYKTTTPGVDLILKDKSVCVSGTIVSFSGFENEIILNTYDYSDESVGLIEEIDDIAITKVTTATTETLTKSFASVVSFTDLTVTKISTKVDKPVIEVTNEDQTLVFSLFATSKIKDDLLSTLESLQEEDKISFEGINLSNNTAQNGVVLTLLQGATVVKK